MNENYEKFKQEIFYNKQNGKKGKLALHKKLIQRMIKDGLTQKQMREFLKLEYELEVTQANLSLFIKKINSKNLLKIKLNQIEEKNLKQVITKKEKVENIKEKENRSIIIKPEKKQNSKPTKQLEVDMPERKNLEAFKKADLSKYN